METNAGRSEPLRSEGASVGEWLRAAAERLRHVTPTPRLEAQVLAAEAMGIGRTALLARPEAPFPVDRGERLLQRRERHEPLAYILGRREFWGREFRVGPGVLVPRQDTETLVEAALALSLPEAARVLEVGVGSGCVAATLALERPHWRVAGTDLSARALEIAWGNAERLAATVDLRCGDLLAPFGGERFDLVVSNPPYIAEDEALAPEVRGYEPPEALFAGEAGLAVYRRLAVEAAPLTSRLLVEVGHTQARAVGAILSEHGWEGVRTHTDLAGIERVVAARRPPVAPAGAGGG